MEGFDFANVDEALEFFEICQKVGANTLEERLVVARYFVKEKKCRYLRDPKAYLEGKNVLDLRSKTGGNINEAN